ncbi:MAG: nickel-dependent hydrogenase large subunit, partial [Acetobacteraceae bacterium]
TRNRASSFPVFPSWACTVHTRHESNDRATCPTSTGSRDANSNLGPIEQALIGAPIADPRDPVEVGHVARSFDSCLVCTVHAHDGKTGKELARFRVG